MLKYDQADDIVMSRPIISKILVPMDGSENAFRAATFALDLASKYGAELQVIHILELNPNIAAMGYYGVPVAKEIPIMQEEAKKQAETWFEHIKKQANDAHVRMESKIIVEFPLTLVGEIVNYAEQNGISMIVMGSRGRTGFKKLLLGSVASGVVTYAPCPVLVIK